MMDFERLFDLIDFQRLRYPNDNAISFFENGSWKSKSISDLRRDVDAVSHALLVKGISPGEKVILVPHEGTYAWVVLDFACQQIGAVTVPVNPGTKEKERTIILEETDARLCIAADRTLRDAFQLCSKGNCTFMHLEYGHDGYFDPGPPPPSDHSILEKIRHTAKASEVVTILYTSGSTGIPKGVMLTHANIIHNIRAILTLLPLEPGQRVISFLPFSHIFERATCYTYLAFGVSIYFSGGRNRFAEDFQFARPFFCTSVPRVLEKMYEFLEEQTLSHNVLKRRVVRWAMATGKQYDHALARKPLYAIQLFIARMLVLNGWRRRLGGKLRYMAVGAASLRPDIGRLFSASGIQVMEGYGMTETAPLISMNRYEPGLNRFGTVGLPIPGIEVRIDAPNEEGEGEIHVKGPNVMKGYFLRPELDQTVFTPDGWLRTGDVGKFTDKRFLTITDRKKDIFKTSAGKYIAPQVLQAHFTQSSFIERCLIIGFQRPFVTALIVPHAAVLRAWCETNHIHWTSLPFMVHNIKVKAKIQEEVNALNQTLPNHERVREFILAEEEWTVESGELTHTLKPVRHLLLSKFSKQIDAMYA